MERLRDEDSRRPEMKAPKIKENLAPSILIVTSTNFLLAAIEGPVTLKIVFIIAYTILASILRKEDIDLQSFAIGSASFLILFAAINMIVGWI